MLVTLAHTKKCFKSPVRKKEFKSVTTSKFGHLLYDRISEFST